MKHFYKIVLLLLTLDLSPLMADKKVYWTFEFLGVDTVNEQPDILEIIMTKTRLDQGLYAVNGELRFKHDLTDELRVEAEVFVSRTGSKSYVRSPFHIPDCKLSDFFNKFYKQIFMETLANCSENSPQFQDKVEMPLTKRTVILHNCVLSRDNLPPYLMAGYYRLLIRYKNQANGYIALEAHVEPDI